MKTLTSALALTVALATTAAADTYVDAHGCLVKPVFGAAGTVLYTNAVITDAGACRIPEDGPELLDEEEVAAPAPEPIPDEEEVAAL